MPQRADRAYGNYNSRSLLAPRRGERGGEVWVWKWVGGFWQETAAGALSGVSASLVTLKEVHRAPHDRALQSSETNLCDFKTMTVRAARIVTSHKKKKRGAHVQLPRKWVYLIVPVISLHRRQLQLQTGHLGHQLQLLGLQRRSVQQLLRSETHKLRLNIKCRDRSLGEVFFLFEARRGDVVDVSPVAAAPR